MKKQTKNSAVYALLFASIIVFFFGCGGLLVTIIEDRVGSIVIEIVVLAAVIVVALVLIVLCCRYILKKLRCSDADDKHSAKDGRRTFWFTLLLFFLITTSTLVMLNVAASFYAVKWPMGGLHGVSSEIGKKAWEYHEDAEGFIKVNSWGQRDREHSIVPAPGTYRMVFLGDSFLEDGAPIPLPYRTEEVLRSMGKTSYELINLGVSATDPDEYYYRFKRIGLPLQPKHCVLMFSTPTDFLQEPTLLSYYGISSTYPRLSFLQLLGLNALDQAISNQRRLILRAWFKGGPLLKHELELKNYFGKTIDDRDTENLYLSVFPSEEQSKMKTMLANASAEERHKFFSMLRHPDEGKFRSYYLDMATKTARGEPISTFIAADYSFKWVTAVYELCRKHSVNFTLVVIPDGFTVDSRMAACYAAITDMKAYMKFKDDAATRLISHATAAGMDVIDLRDLLKQYPGAYLNMDGHWSRQGVDVLAKFLAKRFGENGAEPH